MVKFFEARPACSQPTRPFSGTRTARPRPSLIIPHNPAPLRRYCALLACLGRSAGPRSVSRHYSPDAVEAASDCSCRRRPGLYMCFMRAHGHAHLLVLNSQTCGAYITRFFMRTPPSVVQKQVRERSLARRAGAGPRRAPPARRAPRAPPWRRRESVNPVATPPGPFAEGVNSATSIIK